MVFPALDLWNLVIEVFHSSQNQLSETKGLSVQGNVAQHLIKQTHKTKPMLQPSTTSLDLCNVDSVLAFETETFSIQRYVVCFRGR